MRLAFYTCLALTSLCFWGTMTFLVLYFTHLGGESFNQAALVCWVGCMAFAFSSIGIALWSDRG